MIPLRRELLAGLHGRVLEVGAGNGASFMHYPPGVEQLVALEPEPYLRTQAERAAERAPIRVSVSDGRAEALPLASAGFDATVTCLVLCSVTDPGAALRELRRTLRAGGELRFLEHVRSSHEPKASVQQLLDSSRVWPLLGGGCHCARNTVAEIEAAGMRIEQLRELEVGPSWLHTNPVVIGCARVT